jgi:uncharacterized protein (TIGR02117 family)
VCFAKPNVAKPIVEPTADGGQGIYVVSHGWHTGFVVPATRIQDQLPALRERFGDTPYIEFGWGDKDFYQAKDTSTGLALKAIFWPTESVIHAVAVAEKVDEYFPNSQIEKLCLSSREYFSLMRFISDSIYKNENGKIVELDKGIYGNSQFYKGVGNFYLMNTCNKWTAKGLKSAGMEISPAFKFTADSIMNEVKGNKQAQIMGSTRHSKEPLRSTSLECR